MDSLNYREGGVVFYQVFLLFLYRNCKRLREFEEIEMSSKAVEMTVNNTEENSKSGFLPKIRPQIIEKYVSSCNLDSVVSTTAGGPEQLISNIIRLNQFLLKERRSRQ
jgi:hypothetical protein